MVQTPRPADRRRFSFPPTRDGFREAAAKLGRHLDSEGWSASSRFNLEVVFEEIGVNIVRHASATEAVQVTLAIEGDEAVLTFEDNGVPFDPVAHPDPQAPGSIDEARVGGLGVMLTRKLSARMEYERTPEGRNRLRVAILARPR